MKFKSKGFTLTEVVIAIGVMAILGLGVSQLMLYGMRGQEAVTSNSDINNLASVVQSVLAEELPCKNSLQGLRFLTSKGNGYYTLATWPSPAVNAVIPLPTPPAAVAGIVNSLNKTIVKKGDMYGNNQITALELWILAPDTPNYYVGAIHIQATRMNGGIADGSKVINKVFQIPIKIETVNSGAYQQIYDCPVITPICPPGFKQIVKAGAYRESFCISDPATYFGTAAIFPAAPQICATHNSHICSSEEWLEACHVLGGSFDAATPQWVAPIYTGCGSPGCFDLAGGGGGCLIGGAGGDGYTNAHAFRCCQRLNNL